MESIEVSFYGQLTDLTGLAKLELENPGNTDQLLEKLRMQFPGLERAKFILALNNKIVNENTVIHPQTRIALMPPFSGG